MLQLTSTSSSSETALPDGKVLITERIRGEFREMPGLTLTIAQARRLWNVDLPTCTDVLSQLVESGFLCRKADGTYARTTDITARPLRMAKAGIQFVEIDRPVRRQAAGE